MKSLLHIGILVQKGRLSCSTSGFAYEPSGLSLAVAVDGFVHRTERPPVCLAALFIALLAHFSSTFSYYGLDLSKGEPLDQLVCCS